MKVKTNSEESTKETIFYKNETVENSPITEDTADLPEDIGVSSKNQDLKEGDVNLLDTPEKTSINNTQHNLFQKIVIGWGAIFQAIFNR